jgi:CRP-like cAMP-binding protein
VSDLANIRISRELLLTAFGLRIHELEPWVTDRILALLDEEELPAGRTLFSAGEPAEFLYLLSQGSARVDASGCGSMVVEGRRLLGGLESLFEGAYAQTVVALSDLYLTKMRADALVELLEDSFEIARAAVVSSARALALLQERQEARTSWRAEGDVPPRVPVGALDILDRLALLLDAPFLRRAGIQPLTDLAAASEEMVVEADRPLYVPGGPRDRVLLVVEGEVEAVRRAPDRRWLFRAGEVVCDAAVLGEAAAAWTARAATRVRVLGFRLEDWFDAMEEHFDLVKAALVDVGEQRQWPAPRGVESLRSLAGGV